MPGMKLAIRAGIATEMGNSHTMKIGETRYELRKSGEISPDGANPQQGRLWRPCVPLFACKQRRASLSPLCVPLFACKQCQARFSTVCKQTVARQCSRTVCKQA